MAIKDRLQTVPVIGTALRMQERYRLDAADQFAAAIALFGFLSLVPLLVLAVAVAGFVFSDPAEQAEIARTLTSTVPGLQAAFEATGQGMDGFVDAVVDNRGALAGFGAVTLLLTGLKVINAAMVATTMVLRGALPTGVKGKLLQVAAMPVLGIVALAAAGASSLVGILDLPGALATPIALLATFPLDLLLFLTAYKLFSPTSRLTARHLLPGAAAGALGWAALKIAGAAYVAGQAESASSLYGAFGGIIALLLLLYLAGRLYLYGAELNALLAERHLGPLVSPEAHGVPLRDAKNVAAGRVPEEALPPATVPAAAATAAAVGRRPDRRLVSRPTVSTAGGGGMAAYGFATAAVLAAWRVWRGR